MDLEHVEDEHVDDLDDGEHDNDVDLLLPKTQFTKTFPFSDNAESMNWAISMKCLAIICGNDIC